MMYIAIVPFLFFFNIMVTLTWANTTPFLALLALFFILVRLAENYEALDGFNDFAKGAVFRIWPDVYEKGILPSRRLIMAVAPCIVCMFTNILLERI